MFFMPDRSGMTRWSIWPSGFQRVRVFASALKPSGRPDRSIRRGLEDMEVRDDDLGPIQVGQRVVGHQFAALG